MHQPRGYNGWRHLGLSMGFAITTLVLAASQLSNTSAYEWLTLPITFIYANIVEYVVHRFPMHRPFKALKILFRRHARQHHRFFTEKAMQFDSANDFAALLFPPYLIFFFLFFFALPVGLLLAFVASENVAYLFVVTAFAYFINYEMFHTMYHLPSSHWIYRFKLARSLRELHLHHHNQKIMSHYNFNITYPISDWLFGTYYRDQRNTVGDRPVSAEKRTL